MQMSPIVLQQPTPVFHELPPRRALHVAIISDGNGRWATSRGLPRSAGHRAGAQTARRIISAAPGLGIRTLTLFALSSANWKRPPAEVNAILRLLHEYLLTETSNCMAEGVRLSIIGRRDRMPATLRDTIADSEAATATLQMRLESGLLINSLFSFGTVDDDRYEIYGELGALRIDRHLSVRCQLIPVQDSLTGRLDCGLCGECLRLGSEWIRHLQTG